MRQVENTQEDGKFKSNHTDFKMNSIKPQIK